MADFMFYKIRNKLGVKLLLWVILMMVVLHKLLPMVSPSWNLMISGISGLWMLIKRRPFVYIILNFIIISILISSSSISENLNNLLLKIHKKSSHNISSLISQTSQKLSLPFDDDTWWSRFVNNEETERFTSPLDGEAEDKTVSFEPRGVEKLQQVKEEQIYEEKNDDSNNNDYIVESSKVEEEEEEKDDADTLDATWKAIMDAKNKGSGPQLKKSGTWSSGDRGGGGEVGKVQKGGLAKYKVELKKWRTFSRDVVQEKKDSGGGGWRGREVALTYHDELKKRADAFIARVTHDMRLQRLESDQRLLDTINRGH